MKCLFVYLYDILSMYLCVFYNFYILNRNEIIPFDHFLNINNFFLFDNYFISRHESYIVTCVLYCTLIHFDVQTALKF